MFMGNKVYSHTALSRYNSCPFRYKSLYIDNCNPREGGPSIEFFVEMRVSDALKKFYQEIIGGRLPIIDEVREIYREIWDKEYNDGVLIDRPGAVVEEYFTAGEERLVRYLDRYRPFDRSETIQNDQLVTFFLNPENRRYPLVTVFDRIDRRADGTFEIHFYKSSQRFPHEKVREDLEIGMNLLGFHHRFPGIEKIELVRHDLAEDEERRISMTSVELEGIEAEIMETIDTIESGKKFEPKESEFCQWCERGRKHCV